MNITYPECRSIISYKAVCSSHLECQKSNTNNTVATRVIGNKTGKNLEHVIRFFIK